MKKIKPSQNIPRLQRRLARREEAVQHGAPENAEKNRRRLKTARNDLFKALLRRDATPAEKVVLHYLHSIGIKHFHFQKGFFSPWHIIADFYFPKKKLILEIDGGYHRAQTPKDRARDEAFLARRHLRTIRVKNEDVFSGHYKTILAREGINDLSVQERFTTKWIS